MEIIAGVFVVNRQLYETPIGAVCRTSQKSSEKGVANRGTLYSTVQYRSASGNRNRHSKVSQPGLVVTIYRTGRSQSIICVAEEPWSSGPKALNCPSHSPKTSALRVGVGMAFPAFLDTKAHLI